MPHFKDSDSGLHFLSQADIEAGEIRNEANNMIGNSALALLPVGCVEISDEAAEQLRNPPRPLADLVAAAVLRIDADTDRIYIDTIGARGEEYRRAEADAQQFAQANYNGPVPPFVADHRAAKGWTAQQAADDILATAATWRSAQAQIRANRLQCKELARQAQDEAGVQSTLQQWADFVTTVRGALGIATT